MHLPSARGPGKGEVYNTIGSRAAWKEGEWMVEVYYHSSPTHGSLAEWKQGKWMVEVYNHSSPTIGSPTTGGKGE